MGRHLVHLGTCRHRPGKGQGGRRGNFGAIITAIKSPQAVPWALLILVAYFLFKITVEWYQCNLARRKLWVARIDFISGWIVSLIAYALYFGQTLKQVQLADLLKDPNNGASLAAGYVSGVCVIVAQILSRRSRRLLLLYLGLFVVLSAIVGNFSLRFVFGLVFVRAFWAMGLISIAVPFYLGYSSVFERMFSRLKGKGPT